MKGLAVILLTVAGFATIHGDYQASVYGMQALIVFPDTITKHEFVLKHENLPGFDFLKMSRSYDIPIELLVAPDQIEEFKNDLDRMNVRYEVFMEDVSKVIEEELALQEKARKQRSGDGISFDYFNRYSEVKAYLESLAQNYSKIVETFNIGKSFEGRDIVGIKITSSTKPKPVIVIDAGIHAREWIAPSTALYAINQIVENSKNHHLFKDVDIYIIPSLNPDGYEYTHQHITTRFWRKTRSIQSNVACQGVDGNRNFDIAWATTGGSHSPCAETYAGPKAFSEPETAALRDFILSFNGRVKTYITLHSYGQLMLHPWGFESAPPKNVKQLKCLAQKAAAELFKHRRTRYTIQSSMDLYPAPGTSADWAVGKGGANVSYVLELPGGRYGFAPPPSEIIPVGRETFDALAVFIEATKGGITC